ncbi:MAG: hypothetical protein PHU21_09835 [Elusimicrobia bacterium]|nr:hypothetical protein [Elusimicrobiota bacterium]
MKKSALFLLTLFFVTFSGHAFASNWIFVERTSSSEEMDVIIYGTPYNNYIDGDSVVRDGSKLQFWYKQDLDNPAQVDNVKSITRKYEADTAAGTYRELESIKYDAKGEVASHEAQASKNKRITNGSLEDHLIKIAQKHAKKGQLEKQRRAVLTAANWVLVKRCEDHSDPTASFLGSSFSDYIDANSVTRNGDRLIFWSKEELDKPYMTTKCFMTKHEVDLLSRKDRQLESYHFDEKGEVVNHNVAPGQWDSREVGANSKADLEIKAALAHAKEGKDRGNTPTRE